MLTRVNYNNTSTRYKKQMQVLRERTNEGKWLNEFFPRGSVACRQPMSPLRWILSSPLHLEAGKDLSKRHMISLELFFAILPQGWAQSPSQ